MQARGKIAVAGATGRLGRPTVEALRNRGRQVVEMSRARGVDVITGDGLAEALEGVEAVIDAASWPSPDQQAATEFFTSAARNLHQAGERAGVQRIIVVSIIGVDRFTSGYNAAQVAHERAHLSGPIPVRIVRVAQFYELIEQLVAWGRQGEVSYLPRMRSQAVAARSVGEVLADLAAGPAAVAAPGSGPAPIVEVAGPREENLIDLATRWAARGGDPVKIEPVSDPSNPEQSLFESGALLPGPDAILTGPTFQEWLDASF